MMLKTTLVASLLCSVQAFAPVRQLVRSVPLHSSVSFNEDSAAALMNQAVDCSTSDTCSVEQAEWYLQEIISVQSGCVVGTLVDDAVCENQQVVAQVVAGLRQKILTKSLVADTAANAVTPVMMAGVLMIVTAKILTTNFGGEGTVAFTPEEWMWAFRDNYFPLMVIHFIRDGGMLIDL